MSTTVDKAPLEKLIAHWRRTAKTLEWIHQDPTCPLYVPEGKRDPRQYAQDIGEISTLTVCALTLEAVLEGKLPPSALEPTNGPQEALARLKQSLASLPQGWHK